MNGRSWTRAFVALSLGALACGGEPEPNEHQQGTSVPAPGDEDASVARPEHLAACADLEAMPDVEHNGIAYPDSYCDEATCTVGSCDPLGRCAPACNAWRMEATLSLQAITLSDTPRVGTPPVPTRGDADPCRGWMASSVDAEVNCCQRGDNRSAEHPAFMITSLWPSRPLVLAGEALTGTTNSAMENDLYDVGLELTRRDEKLQVTMGALLPNVDGSLSFLARPTVIGDNTINDGGKYSPHERIAAALTTRDDGTHVLAVGPSRSDRDMFALMWYDHTFDQTRFAFPLRFVEIEAELSKDLACAGERLATGFAPRANASAFIHLDSARKAEAGVAHGLPTQNFCASLAQVKTCEGPVQSWQRAE